MAKRDDAFRETEEWVRPPGLSRRGWLIVGAVVLFFNIPLLHYYFIRAQRPATVAIPYQNDFSKPATVSTDFWSAGGDYRVVDGWLLSPGAKNNPLWLNASLPEDVTVEFDVVVPVRPFSQNNAQDVRIDLFGDGTDHASGYVLVHAMQGGSFLGRLDERAVERKALSPSTRVRVDAAAPVLTIGKEYHWKITRRGAELSWFIDGVEVLKFNDPFPLRGAGHDRIGLSSWENDVFYDRLVIGA